jgi:PAS domain S-box-containing protein
MTTFREVLFAREGRIMVEHVVNSSVCGVFVSDERKKMLILHVDDDSSFLNVAKQCLEIDREFEIDTASSVDEAFEKMRTRTYDVIVSDYHMPGKDGLDFLNELRQNGNTVPFIVFTGKGREEVAVRALNLGANQYLNKTGEPETVYTELARSIREAVQNCRVLAEGKKSEEPAKESERKYRSLYDVMSEGVCFHKIIYDQSGKAEDYVITDANPAFEKITGIKREESVGCRASKLYGTNEPPYLDVYSKVAASGESTSFETYFPPMMKHFSISVFSLAKDVFATVFCDLTERRKTENELRTSIQRYECLFQATEELEWTTNAEGEIVEDLPLFRKFTGQTFEEIKGWNWARALHPDDIERTARTWREAYERRSKYEVEYRLRRHDGVYRRFLARGVPLFTEDGSIKEWVGSCTDVTELKKTEQELRRFSSGVKASLDGIITGELDGTISDVNEAALRIYGSDNRRDLIGKNVQDFLVERDRTRAMQNAVVTIQTGRGKTIEYTALTKNGIEVPIEVTTQLLVDEKGEPTGFVDIVRDLTERKKAEEALKESEERYSRLSAAAFEGIGISERGKITDVNDQLAKMLGYEPNELIGKPVLDIVAPESRDLVTANMQKGYEGSYEHLAVRKDGSVFPVETRARSIHYSGHTQRVNAIRDIIERKELEKSLRESEEKFRGLFSGDPEATVFTDPKMRIVDVNPRFTSLFGYSLEEVKGKDLTEVIVPMNLVEEGKMLDKKAACGYVYHDTVRMKKDGSLVHVSVSAAPISVQGQLIGYMGVYKDISQMKSAEKKLAMMNEKLRVIGGLTRHDVRNKLSIITANAYLSKKRLQDRPEMVESFKEMEFACDMILRIFDFARDYERLGVEELTYVDVEDCFQRAASFFSNIDGTVIENECQGVTVLADSLLRQLFYNLIDNSLKYGEHVTRINVRYEKFDNQLKLIYEDNGVGISAQAKSALFSEGYTTGKGSGYGLYFIKKMMEVYGWTITESGTSGKGAQFVMTIPRINNQGKENYRITE